MILILLSSGVILIMWALMWIYVKLLLSQQKRKTICLSILYLFISFIQFNHVISRANRPFGYLKRHSEEFNDPYTLKNVSNGIVCCVMRIFWGHLLFVDLLSLKEIRGYNLIMFIRDVFNRTHLSCLYPFSHITRVFKKQEYIVLHLKRTNYDTTSPISRTCSSFNYLYSMLD